MVSKVVEDLLRRVEALELDAGFAAGKCKEGLHSVQPVIRESLDVSETVPGLGYIRLQLFFACPHCDRLFAPTTDSICIEEIQVDAEELKKVRRRYEVTVEAKVEEEEAGGGEDKSGLFKW